MSPIESTEVLSYVQWLVMLFWLLHPVPLTVDFSLLQVKTMSIRTSVPVYDVASLIPLRRLVEVIPLKENVCLVDHIGNPFEPELSEDVRADCAESLLSSATGRQIIPCFRRGGPSEAGSRTRCIGETSLAVGDAGRSGSLRRGDHRLCHEL